MIHRPRLPAYLAEDGGAASACAEFFRCRNFLQAEAVTHSLVIDDGRVILPVIRREIPSGGRFDAVSPYGYPGGTCQGDPPNVSDVDFAGTGLVSLFIRERLRDPALRGGVERAVVFIHDPSSARAVHRRVATKARSNERRGYIFEAVPGSSVDDELLRGFAEAYKQTMHRANATERYFFTTDYLRACLDFPASWLGLVRGPDGDLAAGSIAVMSDGYLHYFLGGTADAHRTSSPAKNLMIGLLDLSDEIAVPLNLGGGLRPDDSLHSFKAKFANAANVLLTHGIVCDAEAYAELSHGHDSAGSFPAYRGSPPSGCVLE